MKIISYYCNMDDLKFLLITVIVVSVVTFIGSMLYFVICLLTGKMTIEDINNMVQKEKNRNSLKKSNNSSLPPLISRMMSGF